MLLINLVELAFFRNFIPYETRSKLNLNKRFNDEDPNSLWMISDSWNGAAINNVGIQITERHSLFENSIDRSSLKPKERVAGSVEYTNLVVNNRSA